MIRRALYSKVIGPQEPLPLKDGVYIFGSFEERSRHFENDTYDKLTYLQLIEGDDGNAFSVAGKSRTYHKKLATFHDLLSEFSHLHIYLDITGLSHSLWAPILKCLLERNIAFTIIYAEPFQYSKAFSDDAGLMYDLSEKIRGVSPIPGFTRFLDESDNFIFVPMIGFEGTRFSYLNETVQPLGANVYPIIGAPGFRAEYPFLTYNANRLPLKQTGAWRNVVHAAADCPFAAFQELEKLANKHPNQTIKIGLIGTKPHALGAIMFALAYPNRTEVIYDHPIRKEKRTSGVFKKHIYDVRGFFEASPNAPRLQDNCRLR